MPSATAGIFVGRHRELQDLESALRDAASGRGRICLLAGEAGAGKSRLAEEVAARGAGTGAAVTWGRCWELGGAPPYWPWVQAIRSYSRTPEAREALQELGPAGADVARVIPEIGGLVPAVPEPENLSPDVARFRFFDATASFLSAAAASRPLVLVLDDLHAADEPSLLLLRFVARALPGTRLLILGAYRQEDVASAALADALVELQREPATTVIRLGGLSESEVATVTEQMAGRVPPRSVAAALAAETDGNPLFVQEVVRLLRDEGALDDPTRLQPRLRAIPDTVRGVIGRRLARLSGDCRSALTVASVLGRDFQLDALERMTARPRGALLSLLDEAATARVVAEASVGRFRFSHGLVRDVLYDDLPPAERPRLHERAASTLTELYAPDPEPHLAEIAHHYFEAAAVVDPEKAVHYCRRAAEHAEAVLAYEEAVRLYRMALEAHELRPGRDEGTRCELLLALGEAQARAGDAAGARETFVAAADIAGRRDMAEALARAALGYGGRFVWGRAASDRRLVPLLRQALDALDARDSELRSRLLARLAAALRDEPSPETRTSLSAEAVEVARRLGAPSTLGYALDGRFAAIWGPETTEERLAIATELVRVAEAAGDPERALQGRHYRLICLLELGDMTGVLRELEEKERLAVGLRQPAQRWYLVAVQAMLTLLTGPLADAEERIREALRIGERAQAWDARFAHLLQTFVLRREQGRLAELEPDLRRGVEEYEVYPLLRGVLALALAELGLEAEARELLDPLVARGLAGLPRDNEWLFGATIAAEVAATLGETAWAEELYPLLEPYSGRCVVAPVEVSTGSAARPVGLLAATAGRWELADRHLSDAVAMNDRMAARPWAARARYDHARTLLARGGRTDRERATDLARNALAAAEEIGMPALADRCRELLRSQGLDIATVGRRVTRTFMFTDIVDSTALLEAIGDEGWRELRSWHDRVLRDLFARHGGEEVDHIGDGFFVAFVDPNAAARCAIAIQQRLSQQRRAHGFAPRVRIGIHAGEATSEEGDYSGMAVHQAARIGALAKGEEILVSADTVAGVRADVPLTEARRVTLKGISEPIHVIGVEWGKRAS